MKVLATVIFILFGLTNCFPQKDKQQTESDTKECTQKILLDNKQCMQLSEPDAAWKKVLLNEVKPGMMIMLPPKSKMIFAGSDGYTTVISINMDTTKEDFTLYMTQNSREERDTYEGARKWLMVTSRTCFEFLHDCNKETILRVKDNTVNLKDPTSYSSYGEKEVAGDRYTFYVDGLIIRDMRKGDLTRLTLEDNINVIKVFRSLKMEK